MGDSTPKPPMYDAQNALPVQAGYDSLNPVQHEIDFPQPRGAAELAEIALADLLEENNRLKQLVIQKDIEIAQLRELAETDPLMGIGNRAKLERFVTALESKTPPIDLRKNRCFAGVVDLNDLKRLNDETGHATGDEVLSVTAARIAQVIAEESVAESVRISEKDPLTEEHVNDNRENDRAFRIGGDEIAIVLVIPKDSNQEINTILNGVISRIKGNVLEGISESPILSEEVKQYAGHVSIGFAEFTEGDVFAEVLQEADAAMYIDKNKTKQTKLAPNIGGYALDPQGDTLLD